MGNSTKTDGGAAGRLMSVYPAGDESSWAAARVPFRAFIEAVRTGDMAGLAAHAELPEKDWTWDRLLQTFPAGELPKRQAQYRQLLGAETPAGVEAVKRSKAAAFAAVSPASTTPDNVLVPGKWGRRSANSAVPNGILTFDIDGIESEERAGKIRGELARLPWCLAAHVTASGRGCCLYAVADRPIVDAADYRAVWVAVAARLKAETGLSAEGADGGGSVDNSPCSCASLRFINHDPDVAVRFGAAGVHAPYPDEIATAEVAAADDGTDGRAPGGPGSDGGGGGVPDWAHVASIKAKIAAAGTAPPGGRHGALKAAVAHAGKRGVLEYFAGDIRAAGRRCGLPDDEVVACLNWGRNVEVEGVIDVSATRPAVPDGAAVTVADTGDVADILPDGLRSAAMPAFSGTWAERLAAAAALRETPQWAGASPAHRSVVAYLVGAYEERDRPPEGVKNAIRATLGGWDRGRWANPPPAAETGALPVSHLSADPPRREWVIDGWLPKGRIATIYGRGAAGKSRLTLQLAAAVAGGAVAERRALPVDPDITDTERLKFAGDLPEVSGGGRVLMLSWEDEVDEVARRIAMAGKAGAFDPVAVRAGVDVVNMRKVGGPLWGPAAGGSGHTSTTGELTPAGLRFLDMLEDYALAVVDPLAAAFGSNENDRALVRQFMACLDGRAEQAECAVLLVAHPSQVGEKGGKGGGGSGSTDWRNASRARFDLGPEQTGSEAPSDKPGGNPVPVEAPCLVTDKASYSAGAGGRVWLRSVFNQPADDWLPELAWFATTAHLAALAVKPNAIRAAGGGMGENAGKPTGTGKRKPKGGGVKVTPGKGDESAEDRAAVAEALGEI